MPSEAEIIAAHNARAEVESRHARMLLRLSLLLAAEPNPCRQLLGERMLAQAFSIGARRFLEVQQQLLEAGSLGAVRVVQDGRLEAVQRTVRMDHAATPTPAAELALVPSGNAPG
jgi:hypothetical protein